MNLSAALDRQPPAADPLGTSRPGRNWCARRAIARFAARRIARQWRMALAGQPPISRRTLTTSYARDR